MLSEEILHYYEINTTTDQATILTLFDGTKVVGYFTGKDPVECEGANKWHFKSFQEFKETDGEITIHGDNIINIEIKKRN